MNFVKKDILQAIWKQDIKFAKDNSTWVVSRYLPGDNLLLYGLLNIQQLSKAECV